VALTRVRASQGSNKVRASAHQVVLETRSRIVLADRLPFDEAVDAGVNRLQSELCAFGRVAGETRAKVVSNHGKVVLGHVLGERWVVSAHDVLLQRLRK
jgi:hypothetical protein